MQSSFSTFFFEFSFLDFCLDSIEFFKCMIWHSNPFFFLLLLFFFMTCLLRAMTHIIDGFSGWNTISHVGIVLKGSSFGQMVVHVISVQKKMAQKCSREMDNFIFGQRAPRHQSRIIWRYYGLMTCVFGYWKGVGRLEAIASLDAYQITKYQVLQKLIIFYFLVSEEFEKEILKLEIFLPVV